MTLKEKFQLWHDEPTNETVAENIIDLEKIAEGFAVEFAKWLVTEETEELIFNRMQDDLENTYENMLEIFKKEKGL
jgi:hypothetical protein